MADSRCKIVTKFLRDTCQLHRLIFDNFRASVTSCVGLTIGENEQAVTPLLTGSVAEFYIQPILSSVGDIDIMHHNSDELTIPEGTAPPTQLPSDFNSRVKVFQIIDSEKFPGYVYLMTSYELTECIDDGNYKAVQCPRVYFSHRACPPVGYEKHGPALSGMLIEPPETIPFIGNVARIPDSVDGVRCIRCLSWPSQAADWPRRCRNYGWPDSATVDAVVGNGCDLVEVVHRQCKQDEWMSQHQYRLSFSRAEIVLLNSWIPEQQIIYHMLRYFVKAQRLTEITDDSGTKFLSNYNLKTLMLWTCEQKPTSWWTDDLNFIRICVELLHTLADWLTRAQCQHYFINRCNLFDSLDKSHASDRMANELLSTTESSLAEWFIQTCVHKCAELCLGSAAPQFDNACADLQQSFSTVDLYRQGVLPILSWYCFQFAQHTVLSLVHRFSVNARQCLFWMTEQAKLDRHLPLSRYIIAVILLHVAHKTARTSLTDTLLDVLDTLCLRSYDYRRCRNARYSSLLSLYEATKLMKVVANSSHSTVQLIEIELSKAYLYRALRCEDSDSASIYCLANVYLAVLYCNTGQYQTAIDHCTLVTRSQDHSQCSPYVVQGDLLPKIDDDIDVVIGLSVFYQYLRTAASSQQHAQDVSVFTPELFAHYLCIRCLSVAQHRQLASSHLADEIRRYQRCFCESRDMFTTDVMAFRSVCKKYSGHFGKPTFVKDQAMPVTSGKLDTSELVELLKQSAVEHLTEFRQLEARTFVHEIVTTDVEALAAYRRGDYARCLLLCANRARGDEFKSFVYAFPETIQLMDDDIASVTGLMLIANPSCRERYANVSLSRLNLLMYLTAQCAMKLRCSLTQVEMALKLVESQECVEIAQGFPLDQLLLKLAKEKLRRYLSVDRDVSPTTGARPEGASRRRYQCLVL